MTTITSLTRLVALLWLTACSHAPAPKPKPTSKPRLPPPTLITDDAAITYATFGDMLSKPGGVQLATRYANQQPKCEGTFIRRGSDAIPLTDAITYYPSGAVYQRLDIASNTLRTFHEDGWLMTKLVAPTQANTDTVHQEFYRSGQLKERSLEHFPDGKQRIVLYYGVGNDGVKYLKRETLLRRYEHRQFLERDAFHPNGQPHFSARYHADATTIETKTRYRFFDQHGIETHDSAHYFVTNRTEQHPKTGWINHGRIIAYHRNGNVQHIVHWDRGLKHGPSTHYHPNGHVMLRTHYQQGQTHGLIETFSDAGQPLLRSSYRRGSSFGPLTEFRPNGTALRQYTESSPVKLMTLFDPGGAVVFELIGFGFGTSSRHFEGRPKQPAAGDALRYEGVTDARGLRVGPWTAHTADGVPVYSVTYDELGQLNGVAKRWHDNGQLGVELTFHAGILDGPFQAYSKQGEPTVSGHFDAGVRRRDSE